MAKEQIFKDLLKVLVQGGPLNDVQYNILLEKGAEIGFNKQAVDLLIQLEQLDSGNQPVAQPSQYHSPEKPIADNNEYEFKSAITRGGAVLTPDTIVVTADKVIYRKRNKFLINKDSITIPISRVSSVELDTSILGTDITIKSYGQGVIIGSKFTKADALEIQRLIYERQKATH
jgi:hypothetical protein